MDNKYYFIDKSIYFQGEKQPDRKVELFNVTIYKDFVLANDKDGNEYNLDMSELIIENGDVNDRSR